MAVATEHIPRVILVTNAQMDRLRLLFPLARGGMVVVQSTDGREWPVPADFHPDELNK